VVRVRGDCLADIDAVSAPQPPTWTRAEDTDVNQAPGTNSEGEPISFTVHDDLPREEARLVDDGLDSANDQAASLREVLETFRFQTPQLYLIIKYTMIRRVDPAAAHLQR
jgi:hypothetical protein